MWVFWVFVALLVLFLLWARWQLKGRTYGPDAPKVIDRNRGGGSGT